MAYYLFYHRSHLVDLDRVDDKVLRLVAIFFRSDGKAIRNLFDTVIQDIGKTYQHRGCYIPKL